MKALALLLLPALVAPFTLPPLPSPPLLGPLHSATAEAPPAPPLSAEVETPKTQPGFVSFYESVGMTPCLDPLHSVSARPTIPGAEGGAKSAVYEAVNKESRKNFFIGMHNEFVGT
ncbi:hypothetical protein TeGR_g14213, partial [Tetraparma gracilis]